MSVLTQVVTRLLLAPSIMVAFAILIKGYVDVGDGFSAGVVVALAVSLQYLTFGAEQVEAEIPLLRHAPRVAIAGLLVAIAAGFFPIVTGDPPFTHWPGPGEHVVYFGTLELVTAMLFDIGIFLLVAGSMIALIHHLAQPPDEADETEGAQG